MKPVVSVQELQSPSGRLSDNLVVVVGATGTGKSAAAVGLALALGGEIVNADAMQLYRGLPIASAKLSEAEMLGVPHHLLGTVDPCRAITIHEYIPMCLETIDEIRSRGKVPILVGGTNFYIEKVLFKNMLVQERPDYEYVSGGLDRLPESELLTLKDALLEKDNSETSGSVQRVALYDILQRIDPETASIVHPNDQRRILRSLEVIRNTGMKLSDIHRAQSGILSGNSILDESLRCKRTIICKVECDNIASESSLGSSDTDTSDRGLDTVHAHRLDARVDQMLQAGLLPELFAMREFLEATRGMPIYEMRSDGILQTIGFKEFFDLFREIDRIAALLLYGSRSPRQSEDEGCSERRRQFSSIAEARHAICNDLSEHVMPKRIPDTGFECSLQISAEYMNNIDRLLTLAVDKIKTSTRHYAKSQLRWLRNRFLPVILKSDVICCRISSAELAFFNREVAVAAQCIRNFFSLSVQTNVAVPLLLEAIQPPSKNKSATAYDSADNRTEKMIHKRKIFYCEHCGEKGFQGLDQFNIHLSSRKHRKRVSSSMKKRRKTCTVREEEEEAHDGRSSSSCSPFETGTCHKSS